MKLSQEMLHPLTLWRTGNIELADEIRGWAKKVVLLEAVAEAAKELCNVNIDQYEEIYVPDMEPFRDRLIDALREAGLL